ncbi:MAG: acetate--CoA ligase family protein, partial [Primorskyibacter sp.]
YVVTAGNQAQTDLAEIGAALLHDPRVTALGLHIEGIPDLARFDALARQAAELGKPVVVLRVGQSEQAQAATQSHTASLAGSAAGARALLARLGMAQVTDLDTLLSTLHLLHIAGPLRSTRIGSLSCSGGEASLVADTGGPLGVVFPPLTNRQSTDLRAALGPRVALANPLDYHTYVWGDLKGVTATFTAMLDPDVDLNLGMGMVVLDIPRTDRCDASAWAHVIDAAAAAQQARGVPMAIVATLPDCMPEDWARQIVQRGLVPLAGLPAALGAMRAAAAVGAPGDAVWHGPEPIGDPTRIDEAAAKAMLAPYGLRVPYSRIAKDNEDAILGAPAHIGRFVVKALDIAHKTEAGAVALNLRNSYEVTEAASAMSAKKFLVEEMITGAVAELIIGVVRDPAHGFVLTLGAGGVLTELLCDTVHDILPVTPERVTEMLGGLRMTPVLSGYRGAPAAQTDAIVAAVMAVQRFVQDHQDRLLEAEINPLICTPTCAVAVDALVILGAAVFDDATAPEGATPL